MSLYKKKAIHRMRKKVNLKFNVKDKYTHPRSNITWMRWNLNQKPTELTDGGGAKIQHKKRMPSEARHFEEGF